MRIALVAQLPELVNGMWLLLLNIEEPKVQTQAKNLENEEGFNVLAS